MKRFLGGKLIIARGLVARVLRGDLRQVARNLKRDNRSACCFSPAKFSCPVAGMD